MDLSDTDPSGWTLPSGQPVDIPVPLQVACMRARGLRPRRVRTVLAMTRRPMLPSVCLYGVGTLNVHIFEARYSARMSPCQRFAAALTGVNA